MKKWLLATSLLVSLFAQLQSAFAEEQITFSGALGEFIKFLGPRGVDFVLAVWIVAACIALALLNLPFFTRRGGAGTVGIAIFSIVAGFATGFYVYIKDIPFLEIISSYFIFIVGIIFGLIMLQIVEGVTEEGGKGLKDRLVPAGVGVLVVGVTYVSLSQGANTYLVGGGLILLGIILLVAGVLAKGGWSGWASITSWSISKTLKDTKTSIKEIYNEEQIEAEENKLIKNIRIKIYEILSYLQTLSSSQTRDPNALNTVLETVLGIIEKLKGSVTEVKKLLTKQDEDAEKIKATLLDLQQKISKLEGEERNVYERKHRELLNTLTPRLKKLEEALKRVGKFLEEIDVNGLRLINDTIKAIQEKNFPAAESYLKELDKLLEEIESSIYSEFKVEKEFTQIAEQLKRIVTAEKPAVNTADQILPLREKIEQAADIVQEWINSSASTSAPKTKDMEKVLAMAKVLVTLINGLRNIQDPIQWADSLQHEIYEKFAYGRGVGIVQRIFANGGEVAEKHKQMYDAVVNIEKAAKTCKKLLAKYRAKEQKG